MNRLLLLLLAALTPLASPAEPQLLRAEQAFRYTAEAADGAILLRWQVADGYYLYQKRFGFRSLDPAVSLGPPELPPGQLYEDEFFGAGYIHRGRFDIRIPVSGTPAGGTLPLEVKSQGCADIGVCLPPQTWTAEVPFDAVRVAAEAAPTVGGASAPTVAAEAAPTVGGASAPTIAAEAAPTVGGASAPTVAADGTTRGLLSWLSRERAAQREFLPPEQAFRPMATRRDGGVALEWQIAPGYYLYREQFAVTADGRALAAEFPPGTAIEDEFFGESRVFFGSAATWVELPGDARELQVRYQGCAQDGICYPPTTWTVRLDSLVAAEAAPTVGGASAPAIAAEAAPTGPVAAEAAPTRLVAAEAAPASDSDRLAALITGGALPAVLAVFFGFGLLLAFTPCVLPMVPILSGLIVGQGPEITARRSFHLSAVFVLAMALTYTVAGVVVALLGHNLQATFQHPVVLSGFALVFIALALAMFGFYELQVPAALQTRLAALSNRQQAGTWFGAGAMGVFSALIVGPCVAAPLAAALIVIGASGDPVRGGAALFALSLGMGAPLLAFGASAGRLLPKAGPWMTTIKNLFGILLLGVAVWMLERIVPPAVALALWAACLFLAAIFLGALDALTPDAGPGRRVLKGLGLMGLLYGAVLLVGAASGSGSVWQPLAGLRSGGAPAQPAAAAEFQLIKSVADLERELSLATASGRAVLLDFYADWCVDCKRMERYTFPRPEVRAALDGAVLLKADVTANDAADRELMNRFGIYGPPAILFFSSGGEELRGSRLLGFVPAARFAQHAREALGARDGQL